MFLKFNVVIIVDVYTMIDLVLIESLDFERLKK